MTDHMRKDIEPPEFSSNPSDAHPEEMYRGVQANRKLNRFIATATGVALLSACSGTPTVPNTPSPDNAQTSPTTEPTSIPSAEIAPTQTPENEIVISQSYMTQEQILTIDPLISNLFGEFQNQIKTTKPDATFSAWGDLSRTSSGKQYFTPFFETSENGKLTQEYVIRAKSDNIALVTLRLQQEVVTASDGQEYYTLSQVTNSDTLETIDPIPLIYIGVPKAQYDAMNAEGQGTVEVYFNAFGGILPQNAPDIQNIGNFVSVGKNESYKEIIINMPEGLNNLPNGFVPVRNEDGTWGYGVGTGTEVSPIPDLTIDATGARFLINGVETDIPAGEIQDRIKFGQAGALQIYNEQKTAIDYAFDAENNVWIKASDVLQSDNSNPENYIKIQSLDDIKNLARLEKMVLPPFPENTYFPPLDKIFKDYDSEDITRAQIDEFSVVRPLGEPPENAQPPIRHVNYIILEPDKAKGRGRISYIFTEQVKNVDGSFGLFHFGGFIDYHKPGDALEGLLNETAKNNYTLPRYYSDPNVTMGMTMFDDWDYVSPENKIIDSNGYCTVIKPLVEKWLSSGYVPAELEDIVLAESSHIWKWKREQ